MHGHCFVWRVSLPFLAFHCVNCGCWVGVLICSKSARASNMWQENKTPQAITPQLLLLFLFLMTNAPNTHCKRYFQTSRFHIVVLHFSAHIYFPLGLSLSISLSHSLTLCVHLQSAKNIHNALLLRIVSIFCAVSSWYLAFWAINCFKICLYAQGVLMTV